MKNLSKVLAVVLAFAMALSMVSFAAYTDVKAGDNCEEAVTVLSALEILKGYEDGSFKPEATITRAEFATVVIRLLGLADSASATATMFNDVPATHWASGAIALASQQGIVNGYGDGNFGPEDPVKYNEAIKMIVAALGYTPMADANGGWPGGFQVVASQKGILAGISGISATAEAPRGVVAQLAYNSLTVPLMEQTGFGTQTNFSTVNSLLLNKLGVTKFEGVVSETSLSSSSVKDGKVKVIYNNQITAIAGQGTAKKYDPTDASMRVYCNPVVDASATGNQIFAAGAVEDAAKDLVDSRAILYVKNADSDKAELVCILKDGDREETISFMTEDLRTNYVAGANEIEVYTDVDAGDYEEYTLNINKVYVNGRTRTVEAIGAIPANTAITAANIQAVLAFYFNNANAADVTLLSQVEDEFNVAYISDYMDLKVNRVVAKSGKVYGDIIGGGSEIVRLDEEDKDLKFEIYKDGELASFEDIAENDILSIVGYIDESNDDGLAYGKVYITSEQVEGKVTARSAAANKITVDGVTYKAAGDALTAALGDTAVFYVNVRGVLVARDTKASAATVQYGFASYIRAYDSDYNEPAQLRVLTADGAWKTLNIAKSTIINNVGRKDTRTSSFNWASATDVGSALGYNPAESATKYKVNNVVAFDLNAAGEVSKLYWVDVTDVFVRETVTPANRVFDAGTCAFGQIFLDEETAIFSVDSAAMIGTSAALIEDEDRVSVVAINTIADRDDHMILSAFNCDDDSIVGVLVGENIASGINYADNFFVVSDDPMESTNDAGETGTLLKGIVAGEEVTLFINEEEDPATINVANLNDASAQVKNNLTANSSFVFEKGDVLLYTLNAKGEADKIVVLVDASAVTTAGAYNALTLAYGNASTAADGIVGIARVGTSEYSFVFGYAKKYNGNKLTIKGITGEGVYSFAS
ncbi:MAG: S-layer homology domain-containing protein, partial [Clostridia bacterium]|nr:S-layer homology domain-containing protein [Clostridia bacterium]